MSTLVVIPARWNSSRMPGKPLVPIAGRPLLARTVDLARAAVAGLRDVSVVVATDDLRVAALAASLDCEAVDTSPELTSGTERALVAALTREPAPDIVVNLQGDAPFIPPAAVRRVIEQLVSGAHVATPVYQLTWSELDALRRHKLMSPFSGTTCICDRQGNAIWFSKQIIPAIRDEERLRSKESACPVLRHLGLYGYRLDALKRFVASPPARYEQLEGLEQLRFLELRIPIRAVLVDEQPIAIGGIDTTEDVALAERLLAAREDAAP